MAGDQAEALLDIIRRLSEEMHPRKRGVIQVNLDSSLEKDLGIDSLGRMELLLRIEENLDVSLSEQVLASAETPRDLLRAVSAAGGRREAAAPPEIQKAPSAKAAAVPEEAKTLVDVLDWHVGSHPDGLHIYLYGEGEREEVITYEALRQGADAVAAGLIERGLQPGQTVAIMLPTGRDYFYSFFGILLAGGIPVPLYPPARLSQIEDHLRRHAAILDNALSPILVTMQEAQSVARLLKSQVTGLRSVVTARELSAGGGRYTRPTLKSDDIAILQYTSGTTGTPKGVVLTHANLLANIRAMGNNVEASSRDVFVSWLPLYHDMGLIGAWLGSLYYAMQLVLMPPLTFLARPERWLWAIHRHRGTISGGPNFGYELCIGKIDDEKIKGLDLSSWRMAFNGAEAVSPRTISGFLERFSKYGFRDEAFAPVYGLAESSVGLAFPPLNRGPVVDRVKREPFVRDRRALPAEDDDRNALDFVASGQPLAGHDIRVVDDAGRELGERLEGRLQFKGPSATSGYFRNPEASSRLFQGEWLDAGDLAYMAGGDVFITGRSKDIIIRAGRNIYPDELEEAVGNIDGVRKGCVAAFGSRDAVSGTERLVILAESRETDEGILERLRSEINSVTVDLLGEPPEDVILAPPHTVLKTSSGKVRRAASRDLYESGEIGGSGRAVWRQFVRLAWAGLVPQLRRFRRAAAEFFYASYVWALFLFLAAITWTLVAIMPNVAWRRTLIRAMARIAILLSGTPLTVRGLEKLPSEGACVIVANHSSYLDGIMLTAALPALFGYVAKRELTGSFIPRIFLRRIRAEFVERFDMERGLDDARRVSKSVQEGRAIVFFPEGTFTRAPGLRPFHMGAFITAAETGAPVVPVTIRGTRSMFRAYSWFPRRGAVTVTIGEPVKPEGSGWSAAIKLRDSARLEILRHCGEPDLTE